MAKCPKCDASLTSVTVQSLTFKVGGPAAYGGVSYCCCCPSCDAVLSAVLDPETLKSDIMREYLNQRKKAAS